MERAFARFALAMEALVLATAFPSLRHYRRRGAKAAHRSNASTSCGVRPGVRNPVFRLDDGRVRDPAVVLLPDGRGYELYFTHYRGNPSAMFSGGSAKAYAPASRTWCLPSVPAAPVFAPSELRGG